MIETSAGLRWQRVTNDSVWRSTKIVFLGSLLVFLINIALGFGNVITPGEIPRWQILTHLHGGTIGWLSLTAVGFTIWLFTGARSVSRTYEKRIRWLAWAAVLIGLGYVVSYGIAALSSENRAKGSVGSILPNGISGWKDAEEGRKKKATPLLDVCSVFLLLYTPDRGIPPCVSGPVR